MTKLFLGGGKLDIGLNVYLPPPSVKGTSRVGALLENLGAPPNIDGAPNLLPCGTGGGGGKGERGGVATGELLLLFIVVVVGGGGGGGGGGEALPALLLKTGGLVLLLNTGGLGTLPRLNVGGAEGGVGTGMLGLFGSPTLGGTPILRVLLLLLLLLIIGGFAGVIVGEGPFRGGGGGIGRCGELFDLARPGTGGTSDACTLGGIPPGPGGGGGGGGGPPPIGGTVGELNEGVLPGTGGGTLKFFGSVL